MINKYKDKIIDLVWQYIDWKKSDEISCISFVCDNTKKVINLSYNEFLLYRDYTRYALPVFLFHEKYKKDNFIHEKYEKDNFNWEDIATLFFDIHNCGRQEFVERYLQMEQKQKQQMELLPKFCLEIGKFLTIYNQLYIRIFFLSQNLLEYDRQKFFKDYINRVDVSKKVWSMINAYANTSQPNPLKYLDVSIQSDKNLISDKKLHDYVFKCFEEHTIPFTYEFVEQLKATERELIFQMLISMLDFVEDKKIDSGYRQLEQLVWGQQTPFYPLFQKISQHADDFNLKKEGQKYNWKEVLELLTSEESELGDISNIIFSKEDATETDDYFRVMVIKYTKFENQNRQDLELYKCLKKLYHKLNDEYLAFDSPCEDAFIYRLSGFNRPDNLKIKWIGEYAFLGKIIRCLYENSKYKPKYKKIASFMGVKANIAAAGQIIKGAKGTKDVIELLTECGFINVDVFEDPFAK